MRPCSFSTDSAVFRSGGGTAAPEGGKAAEAFGDTGFQLRLVVFRYEQVIAFASFDGLANFALAKDGIAGDNRAIERQLLQECKRGTNFVLAGLHNNIADDRGQ